MLYKELKNCSSKFVKTFSLHYIQVSSISESVATKLNILRIVVGLLKDVTEERLRQVSPFKIIILTAGATYSVAFLQNFLSGNELSKKMCNNLL